MLFRSFEQTLYETKVVRRNLTNANLSLDEGDTEGGRARGREGARHRYKYRGGEEDTSHSPSLGRLYGVSRVVPLSLSLVELCVCLCEQRHVYRCSRSIDKSEIAHLIVCLPSEFGSHRSSLRRPIIRECWLKISFFRLAILPSMLALR